MTEDGGEWGWVMMVVSVDGVEWWWWVMLSEDGGEWGRWWDAESDLYLRWSDVDDADNQYTDNLCPIVIFVINVADWVTSVEKCGSGTEIKSLKGDFLEFH